MLRKYLILHGERGACPLCHFEPVEGTCLPRVISSRAAAKRRRSREIFTRKPREPYAVCLVTRTVSDPRAAGQRPVRLAAVPSRRLIFRLTGAAPLQCVRIAAGIRPRSPQAERLALPLQASKAFTSLQGDTKRQNHLSIIKSRAQKSLFE